MYCHSRVLFMFCIWFTDESIVEEGQRSDESQDIGYTEGIEDTITET
jgi:hypothetical protein